MSVKIIRLEVTRVEINLIEDGQFKSQKDIENMKICGQNYLRLALMV